MDRSVLLGWTAASDLSDPLGPPTLFLLAPTVLHAGGIVPPTAREESPQFALFIPVCLPLDTVFVHLIKHINPPPPPRPPTVLVIAM